MCYYLKYQKYLMDESSADPKPITYFSSGGLIG